MVRVLLLLVVPIAFAQTSLESQLVKAAEANNLKQVQELLAAGARPELPKTFSAIEAAAAGAFPAILREMLRKPANLNARDSAGRTVLHVVGETALEDARDDIARVTRILIANGADVNARDRVYGNTLLHHVPNAETAKVLIDAGARLNILNNHGQTPLMLTLDENVARLLVNAGADISIRDSQGKTALDLARELQLTEKIAVLTRGRQ